VVFGLTIFLFISAILNARRGDNVELPVHLSLRDQLLLIAIIATVVAHFVEIHTGIAIAATRTNFWVLISVMVVVGAGFIASENERLAAGSVSSDQVQPAAAAAAAAKPGTQKANTPPPSAGGTRRQRRAQQAAASSTTRRSSSSSTGFVLPGWFGTVATYGLMLGLVLAVLAFDFTNNTTRYLVPGEVFLKAMTELPAGAGRAVPAPGLGVLAMFLLTLGIGTVIIAAELRRSDVLKSNEQTVAAVLLVLSVAAFVWIAFGTFIAGRLVDFISSQQGNTIGNVLAIADQLAAFPAYVYTLIVLIMVASAFLLRAEERIMPAKTLSWPGATALGVGAFALVIWPGTVATSNLQPIAADIIYKQANPWDQSGGRELVPGTGIQGWDLAIEHYRKAIQLAPNEDFYYLWLGRALLEKAKVTPVTTDARLIPDDASFTRVIGNEPENWNRVAGSDALPSAALGREDLFSAARIILEEARVINPLNTDHSANLARMWQQQAEITADAALKAQRYANSDKEYATATRLSPNNAQLWNEWARLSLFNLRDFDAAKQKLDTSLALDQKFSPTYLLRAAWHLETAAGIDRAKDEAAWRAELESAKAELQAAIAVDPNALQAYQELTRIDIQLGDTEGAISATQKLLEKTPNDWNSLKNLAVIYSDTNRLDLARQYATQALAFAPEDQKAVLQAFIQSLAAAP
jgi:tetratricopeptide (TPR) repeat protein